MINVLKKRFVLLDKKNKLVFLATTKYKIKYIKKTQYICLALSINIYKTKSLSTNINIISTYYSLHIVNKLSMIYIRLFLLIHQ